MLDLRAVRENPEAIRNALKRRHQTELLTEVDRLLDLDKKWRETTVRRDGLRSEQNTVSKEIGRLKREKQDASDVIARMGQVAQEVRELDDELRDARAQMDAILLMLPNIPHADVPDGATEDDNVIVKEWGERPSFEFEPKAHWDIGEELGVIAHFFGESMAHVDPVLFPPYKTTWFRRLMHSVGRYFFVRKVRGRKGIRVVPRCHGPVDCVSADPPGSQ